MNLEKLVELVAFFLNSLSSLLEDLENQLLLLKSE
jgi:hypothetical protein